MKLSREIYEFGAHAGSFEGYVYGYTKVDPGYLPQWAANLLKEYHSLPGDVIAEIQPGLDGTLGRAVRTLGLHLGEDHQIIVLLKEMIRGKLPDSPDDFEWMKQLQPGSCRELYEFAASAGAFEGYVYMLERADRTQLADWSENLANKWRALSAEVRAAIELSTNLTLGRALHSLKAFLNENDPVIFNLKIIVRGRLPASADDFIKH